MVVFPILQGRSVGLAIVYGVAPNDAEIDQALQIATKVYAILKGLGQEGYFFQRASYYVPLFSFGPDPSRVEVDVYLFIQ